MSKFLTVLLMVSLISVSVHGSVSYDWDGPVVFHATMVNSSTIYGTEANGLYPINALTPTYGPGAMPGEDSWGILVVDSIHKGYIDTNNNIQKYEVEPAIWKHGDGGSQLIGMYYGESDIAVQMNSDLSQTAYGVGVQFDVYDQPVGSFEGWDGGSADRTGVNTYDTVGGAGGIGGGSLGGALYTSGGSLVVQNSSVISSKV